MLRAIVSNRLSSKNDEKENVSIYKTPGKKGLKNSNANKQFHKNSNNIHSVKKKKTQAFGEKIYESNCQNIDIKNNTKVLDMKQYSLKTPLKIHQRTPLSNLKKTNIDEQNNKSIKKSIIPSKATSLNVKRSNSNSNNNDGENQGKHNLNIVNSVRKKYILNDEKSDPIFEKYSSSTKKPKIEIDEEDVSDIEYMPPTNLFKEEEEEIKSEFEINFKELVKFQKESLIDSKLFKRFYSDIEIESPIDTPKSKDFEFVDNFILDDEKSIGKKDKIDEEKKKENENEENSNELINNKQLNELAEKENDNKTKILEEINKKIYDSSDEDEDEEKTSLPDFYQINNESMYFEEIKL